MTAVFHDGKIAGAVILAAAATLFGGCATRGDYGDAPDGGPTGYRLGFAQIGAFPTRAASNGAVTADVSQATLGPSASVESDADDAADPDGQPNLNPANTDADNGIVDFTVLLVSIPPPAAMTVNISAPPGGGGAYWVNVLIDLNLDGRWGGMAGAGLPEWVVKNFPVQVAGGASAQVPLPPFSFGFGNRLPDGAWMRILLSREPVSGTDWNGGGRFGAGEVEDHVITLPTLGPDKRIVIQMSCPRRVFLPRGAPAVGFTCAVSNVALSPTAGSFSYQMQGIPPNGASVQVVPLGVAAGGCLPPPPAPPGGPVACGNPPLSIPIAGAGPVALNFVAIRRGPLPSQWTYSAVAEDPPSVVTPRGVTVGYGPSRGSVNFEDVEIRPDATVKLTDDAVLVLVSSKDPRIGEPIEVRVAPGESFAGLTYDELRKRGEGPIRLEVAQ